MSSLPSVGLPTPTPTSFLHRWPMCAAVGCSTFPFSSAQQTCYACACVAKFAPVLFTRHTSTSHRLRHYVSFPQTTRSFFTHHGRQMRVRITWLCSRLFRCKSTLLSLLSSTMALKRKNLSIEMKLKLLS